MNQEFFTVLPSEVVIDILSRLPVRTIIHCKCVCKSWLSLVESHEFVKFHLSKSIPGMVTRQIGMRSESYKIFEFEVRRDLEHYELHYNLVSKFDLPLHGCIQGSANGLLFLRNRSLMPNSLCICNPITRDYIKINCPQKIICSHLQAVAYGFGASKMTGQYKVVRIFHDDVFDQQTFKWLTIPESECQVYTLGTGSWRSVAPGAAFVYSHHSNAAFLNGKLHWLVFDLDVSPWISCFDLGTEFFSSFASPPPLRGGGQFLAGPSALKDCLCLCDNTSDDEVVIWLMKEYGVDKSWTKEFIIRAGPDFGVFCYIVYPIKVFKDGGILMTWHDLFVFYSDMTETTQKIDIFELPRCVDAILHTPSFLSLKSFAMENVSSF